MKKNSIDRILNELSLISAMASLESASRTKKLTNSIINYLRYKNSRENQIVRLGEELRFVKEMIYVQEVRYENLLKCNVSVDIECERIYIPHYTIMTFVENAFNHAFETIESDWKLEVICKAKKELLTIDISDNGIGFNSDIYLLENSSTSFQYGTINSIYCRLKNQYGNSNVLQIQSVHQKGTRVSINIPTI